jgi:hypothetical protein
MQEKDSKILELKQQAERSDKMLKKHLQENSSLKKQINSGGSFVAKGNDTLGPSQPKPERRDFKTMRAERKQNA